MTALPADRLAAAHRSRRPSDTLFRFAAAGCASIVLILLSGMLAPDGGRRRIRGRNQGHDQDGRPGHIRRRPPRNTRGLYLSEYRARGLLAALVRFFADVMTGIPSIFVGIFVFTVVVLETHSFSTWAGGLALGILMLPVIGRTSEEAMQLVPKALREAALALGIPRWRTILSVILPTALPGITTGALLAVARAAGETAPCC